MISSTYESAPINVFKFFRSLLYQEIRTRLFIEVKIKMSTSCLHWGFIFFFLHFFPGKKKFSSFMKFSLELRFANAFYHCNYFLPNEKTNNLSMYIFFTFWDPLDLYTFLIQVLKGALLVFVHHGLGLSFLIINITNTTRNQTNKKQKTELYKSYFHQVHSCVVETSKIKKGNKKKNLEPPEFT